MEFELVEFELVEKDERIATRQACRPLSDRLPGPAPSAGEVVRDRSELRPLAGRGGLGVWIFDFGFEWGQKQIVA